MLQQDEADCPYFHQEWKGIPETTPIISGARWSSSSACSSRSASPTSYRGDPSALSHMGQEHVDTMHLSPQDDIFLPGRAIWWKTVLVETGHGEIRRVVSVLALHIRQES
jgi:hypothetical protein